VCGGGAAPSLATAKLESPPRIFLKLYPSGGSLLDRSLDSVDRSIEVPLGNMQRGLLGLSNLLCNPFVLDLQVGVVFGLVADDRGVPLVLPGVGSYISKDA
jgi:hypothetical protein